MGVWKDNIKDVADSKGEGRRSVSQGLEKEAEEGVFKNR